MTMNDGGPPSDPPKGLLAGIALAESTPAVVEQKDAAPGTPHDLPIDPNYCEPITLVVYRKLADDISRIGPEEIVKKSDNRGKLIGLLLTRIEALETALLPITQQGMVMSNATLCLRGVGRGSEPPGGHWVNQVSTTHLAPSFVMFFNAIDVLGRERSQLHMIENFQRVQDAQKLVAERAEHIAAGGKIN